MFWVVSVTFLLLVLWIPLSPGNTFQTLPVIRLRFISVFRALVFKTACTSDQKDQSWSGTFWREIYWVVMREWKADRNLLGAAQ